MSQAQVGFVRLYNLLHQHKSPAPEMNVSSEKSWLAEDPVCCPLALLQECYQWVSEVHKTLSLLDKAGSHLSQSVIKVLEQTAYRCVAGVLADRMSDVFTAASSQTHLTIIGELERILAGLISSVENRPTNLDVFGQTFCQVALLLTKMNIEYFSQGYRKMTEVLHGLLHLTGEDPASLTVSQLIMKLGLTTDIASMNSNPWDSSQIKTSRSEAESQVSYQLQAGSCSDMQVSSHEEKVTILDPREEQYEIKKTEKEGIPVVSVTAGSFEGDNYVPIQISGPELDPFSSSHPKVVSDQLNQPSHTEHGSHHIRSTAETHTGSRGLSTPVIVSSRSHLATEEELESVINLLSGVGYGSASPMQVIPEVSPLSGSMQLTVPQIYRTLSPVSDTHLEDRRKSQVHRRSEGCLDLSAVGHNVWPQCHHRASLPSVQIYSASGHRCGYDPPSPVPPYIRDSPSPNYNFRDPPSPGYFRGDPPSPFRTHYAKTLGANMAAGLRPNMLSPSQWSPCPPPPGVASGRFSGLDPSLNQPGTWPMYGGVSSVSPSVAETSSWVGAHDCSDLSDDSSTEDQFFAVGKDLTHMISSKDGSSDEETESAQQELSKSSNTWPPPDPHLPLNLSRGLTPELLEPPEIYNPHKPIQMQWSDPLSGRSVWQPSSQDASHHKTSQSMQGFGGGQ